MLLKPYQCLCQSAMSLFMKCFYQEGGAYFCKFHETLDTAKSVQELAFWILAIAEFGSG
jgi:hypothetical protein